MLTELNCVIFTVCAVVDPCDNDAAVFVWLPTSVLLISAFLSRKKEVDKNWLGKKELVRPHAPPQLAYTFSFL